MLSQRLKNLTPYIPGEQPQNRDYIKLNTNENPYPPAPSVAKFLKKFSKNTYILSRYPDPQSKELRDSIAKFYNIESKNIFVGNGSDEVLAMAFFSFFDSQKGDLLFPTETYSFYPVYCNFYGIKFKRVDLKSDYSISIDDYIDNENYCGIILTNPNAPTGMVLPLSEIKRLLDNCNPNRVVIIDEAYIDFGGESAISLIDDYPNLLIVQTFSKSRSLAGLRLGYAIGNEKLTSALTTAKDSFNSYPADRIAQQIGKLAIEDKNYFSSTIKKINKTREKVSLSLINSGWKVLPSSANFIFAKHSSISGKEIYTKLKENGILVRWFDKKDISDFIRITIGLPKDMDILISKLKDIEKNIRRQPSA